jgi:hypothetical protein
LPSVKTDLLALTPQQDVLVWFGHSSYFIQAEGKRFLADPVFSGSASPIPGGTKAFNGADIYTVDDFPAIDYLFISHDHYDHLDYKTILALKRRIGGRMWIWEMALLCIQPLPVIFPAGPLFAIIRFGSLMYCKRLP